MLIGDLEIIGAPPKPKLLKALAVLAHSLHPAFDARPDVKPFCSRYSCVLVSLAVRDFLQQIGFATARVRPVCVVLRAERPDGEQLHSAAIGAPHDKRHIPGRWTGHMVVTVAGWVIDSTLYQVRRPAWPDLTGMVAVPLHPRPWQRGWWDLDLMASAGERELAIGWFDNPNNNNWKLGPDARNSRLRAPVVRTLIETFGEWHDDGRAT